MRVFKRLALIAGAILGLAAGTVSVSAHRHRPRPRAPRSVNSRSSASTATRSSSGATRDTGRSRWRTTSACPWTAGPVGVRELKPGMKGTATITTTTTSTPVSVTQIRDGVVMQKTGNSIVVRSADGIKMFSEGDAAQRGVRILRDGQPLAFTDLNVGDHLTATIVTTHPPKIMTRQQVAASMSSAPAPMTTPRAETPTRMAAATPVAAPSAPDAAPEAPPAAQDGQPVAADRAAGSRLHAARAHAHRVEATALGVSGSSTVSHACTCTGTAGNPSTVPDALGSWVLEVGIRRPVRRQALDRRARWRGRARSGAVLPRTASSGTWRRCAAWRRCAPRCRRP